MVVKGKWCVSFALLLALLMVIPLACTQPAPDATKPPATPASEPAPSPSDSLPATPKDGTEATPVLMPRGTADPDIVVDVYVPEKAWPGTTLLADNHNTSRPRIIEVNMLGEIIWQYVVPSNLSQFNNPGFDVEPLPNGNVLFVLPRNGVYEIDRNGKTVWSYLTSKISHDADRLPNGNTLIVFGAMDKPEDPQIRELTPKGEIIWAWRAKDHFDKSPYKDISEEGWTHTNAVSRLPNGNTLVSLRNFGLIAELDPQGSVIRTIGEGKLQYPHDPQMLPNGIMLLANHNEPQRAIEIDPKTGNVAWEFIMPRQLVRDANRLPNGNILITGSTRIAEVTRDGEIVWRLELKTPLQKGEGPGRGFYKAERISAQK